MSTKEKTPKFHIDTPGKPTVTCPCVPWIGWIPRKAAANLLREARSHRDEVTITRESNKSFTDYFMRNKFGRTAHWLQMKKGGSAQ